MDRLPAALARVVAEDPGLFPVLKRERAWLLETRVRIPQRQGMVAIRVAGGHVKFSVRIETSFGRTAGKVAQLVLFKQQ